MFGVYDGHGVHGHDCATYAKENLPDLIAKYVRKKRVGRYQQSLRQSGKSVKGSFKPKAWPKLSDKEYEEACRKGFLKCNTDMHQNQEVCFDSILLIAAETCIIEFVCFLGKR